MSRRGFVAIGDHPWSFPEPRRPRLRVATTPTRLVAVITAIVLVSAEVDRIPEVAEAIAGLPGVSEVYSVTGEFDLIALVRVRRHDELAEVIPGRLNKVDGVLTTETHIAFRTYSQHDLEAAFSLGAEDGD
jgi:DNA-binding Lrp family transcriptional regulator